MSVFCWTGTQHLVYMRAMLCDQCHVSAITENSIYSILPNDELAKPVNNNSNMHDHITVYLLINICW